MEEQPWDPPKHTRNTHRMRGRAGDTGSPASAHPSWKTPVQTQPYLVTAYLVATWTQLHLGHRKEKLKLFTQITSWIRKSGIPPMAPTSDRRAGGGGSQKEASQPGCSPSVPWKFQCTHRCHLATQHPKFAQRGGPRSTGPRHSELWTQNSVPWPEAAPLFHLVGRPQGQAVCSFA